MITDIYRIKTKNSIYEVHLADQGRISRCRKEHGPWQVVKADSHDFIDKLVIGASFDVPGVVLTSVVEDYVHLVPSDHPKKYLEKTTTIPGFFDALTEHVRKQVHPHAVVVRGENDEESYA